MNTLAIVAPGMLIGLGFWLIASAFRPQHPQLADALASLDAGELPTEETGPVEHTDRLGAWWLRRRPVAVTPALQRQLQLRGRTLTRHYTLKLAFASIGFLLPLGVGIGLWVMRTPAAGIPAVFSLVGLVVGFVLPDVLLRRAADETTSDATESLLTFFDLVTLERLANRSATQALHAAAELSDVAIFATIRAALDRARLEQRMPYTELRDVGRRLELPALVDLADVMRLDDTGASLAEPLRARGKELRDAHLTAEKIAAAEVSERMTFFMVIPSMIFGLFFLIPPLLRLIGA